MELKNQSLWDRLRIKWHNAEQVIYELAAKTFLQDWCFLNPKFSNGTKELCDLLVIFEDTVIIRQIKDLKLDEKWQYKRQEKEKNIRQLWWAKRTLLSQQSQITLTNDRRGKVIFDPTTIKNVYLISALVGEGEYFFSFMEEIKSHQIHVFNHKFIEIILNELDTISDFCHYLKAKEDFLNTEKKIIISGWEEELLAPYIHNNRSFSEFDSADMIILEEGVRKGLTKKPDYIAKKKKDEISYFWDYLIEKTHQWWSQYELVACELARSSRFERRLLSKIFIEGSMNADKDNIHDTYPRFIQHNWVTYCFLYQDRRDNNARENTLINLCSVARMEFDNPKVIGIATEQHNIDIWWPYDFLLMDIPTLSDKEIKKLKILKNELNILQNPQQRIIHEDEYPIQK